MFCYPEEGIRRLPDVFAFILHTLKYVYNVRHLEKRGRRELSRSNSLDYFLITMNSNEDPRPALRDGKLANIINAAVIRCNAFFCVL